MAGETLVVLRGGSRDGESTMVPDDLARLVAVSEAPGLLDVYEPTEEFVHLRGNEEPAQVWVFSAQQSIDGIAPEMIHMPPRGGRTDV